METVPANQSQVGLRTNKPGGLSHRDAGTAQKDDNLTHYCCPPPPPPHLYG